MASMSLITSFLVQHSLEEGHCETAVDEATMIDSHSNEAINELEIFQDMGLW